MMTGHQRCGRRQEFSYCTAQSWEQF
jgi:low affinity Fe/Cu permease